MRAARLAAHQLQRIGVLLLRHHAAAGAERVGQLEEAMLVAAEDDQILGQPAQMHHRHRARVEERRREVAIRRRVHAVVDDAREAEVAGERVDVDGVRRAGNRAGAERQRVAFVARGLQAREIAAQRRRVRQEEVRDEHRLRRTEVRERRHQRVARRRGLRGQRVDDAGDRALQQRDAPPQVEPQIERHLLVARAAGVQPAAGVAEPLDQQPLDEAVDVLVGAGDERRIGPALLEDRGQRVFDLPRFLRRQHAGLRQRARPRHAAGHVVFEQAAIEAERRAELERRGVGRGVEAAGPQVSHQSSRPSVGPVGERQRSACRQG